jgi:UDP-glucose:(heptosyl)LPS alpha-1,3-glucosyltransferase
MELAAAAERRLYRSDRCRRIIAVSGRLRGELLEDYDLPAARLTVIPNGVDTGEFNPTRREAAGREVRARLGLAAGAPLALFMGGDWERKGLATLLAAFAGLAAEAGRGLRLAVVGPGDSAAWRRRAGELGLDGRAFFPGATASPAEWYAAADFLVLPTRYEPFGLTPLECGACGTPAVFSALCGCAEVLPDGEAGLHLRDPMDAGELRMKIEALAADEELRRRLAAGALAVAGRCGWARVAEDTEKVFEQVLAEKRDRR